MFTLHVKIASVTILYAYSDSSREMYTLTLMMANMGATKVQIACVPLPEESQQLHVQVEKTYYNRELVYMYTE